MREVKNVVFFARRRAAPMLVSMALPAMLGACSYLPELPSLPGLSSIKPYRIDIQQGNYLSAEMVAQLKEGMTREQVRFILGTPLVADIFHANRWDYVFYRELGDGRKENHRVSVFFENEKLARFTRDNVPSAVPARAVVAPKPPAAAIEQKPPAEQAAPTGNEEKK